MNQFSMLRLTLTMIAMIMTFGCSKDTSRAGGDILVVVSIPPLAEFVEHVGGEHVNVHILVPPGASPHSYEPRPGQLKIVSNADMFIKVGTAIEFELAWLDKLVHLNKAMQVVDASQGIQLIHDDIPHKDDHENNKHYHGLENPHIWLSLRNARQIVRTICDGLIKIDPDNGEYYKQNCASYIEQLESLDKKTTLLLNKKQHRYFLVYHPAWGYFARDYHLHELAIEQAGKSPTLKGMQEVIQQARDHHIHIIFASPQFSQTNAQRMAKEIDGQVILISPMEKEYLKNMEFITSQLAASLY